MNKPLSPEEIMEELNSVSKRISSTYGVSTTIDPRVYRSFMRSLLEGVKEKMPKRDGDMFPGISAFADGEELAKARQRGMEYGYDIAISDCLSVIQSTIDSIKE